LLIYLSIEAALPADLKGKNFTKIFGTQQGPLERFIIKKKIMGPSWLSVKNFKRADNSKSWTKMEIIVNDMSHVEVADVTVKRPAPLLRVLSLSMKTVVNATTHANEVILISGVFHSKGI
jgi:DNA polymerase alpha subunit A